MSATAPVPPSDPDRLHGWKEIASFVGKGVRTVQRWEKEHGLPVSRLGESSDIVLASRREIDAWLRQAARRGREDAAFPPDADAAAPALPLESTVSPPPTAAAADGATDSEVARPSRPAWVISAFPRWAVVAAVALLALGAGTRWATAPGVGSPSTTRQGRPVRWELDGKLFRALDAANRPLWEKGFAHDFEASTYVDETGHRVWMEDLDGDGSVETSLVVLGRHQWPNARLVVINEDGSTRFEHRPKGTVRFGSTTYTPPWFVNLLFVTPDGNHRRLWSVSYHVPEFPSLLERLDPSTGQVLSSYWSNGYIYHVRTTGFRGRQMIAVGATNNDTRGGSLALLAADSVKGAAPAEKPDYRCTDCPAGSPEVFIVFPRSCLLAEAGVQAWVDNVDVNDAGQLMVAVRQAPAARGRAPATVTYFIDPDLGLAGIDLAQGFEAEHARARREGFVDHDMGEVDRHILSAVRRWDGQRFVPVSAPPPKP